MACEPELTCELVRWISRLVHALQLAGARLFREYLLEHEDATPAGLMS